MVNTTPGRNLSVLKFACHCPDREPGWCSICQVNIYALSYRSIVWSLLCYCLRARDHCCVLCDVTRDLLFTWYTAISRKVVGKNVHATIPKGNMGYEQYTAPDTVAVEYTFASFLYHSQTYDHGLSCYSFKFLWRTVNSKPPTIPFGIVACTFSDNLSRNSCICTSREPTGLSTQMVKNQRSTQGLLLRIRHTRSYIGRMSRGLPLGKIIRKIKHGELKYKFIFSLSYEYILWIHLIDYILNSLI